MFTASIFENEFRPFEGCFQRPKLEFLNQTPNVVCDEKCLITVLYFEWFWLGWIGVGQQLAKLGICIPIAMSNVKLMRFVDLMSLQYQQFALLSTWWPWSSVIWGVGQKYYLPSDPIVPNDPIRSVHQRAWSVERKICKTMQDGDFCPAMHLLKCCLNLLPPNLAILPTLPVFVQSKIQGWCWPQFLSLCTMPTKPQSYPERYRRLRHIWATQVGKRAMFVTQTAPEFSLSLNKSWTC